MFRHHTFQNSRTALFATLFQPLNRFASSRRSLLECVIFALTCSVTCLVFWLLFSTGEPLEAEGSFADSTRSCCSSCLTTRKRVRELEKQLLVWFVCLFSLFYFIHLHSERLFVYLFVRRPSLRMFAVSEPIRKPSNLCLSLHWHNADTYLSQHSLRSTIARPPESCWAATWGLARTI